MQIAQITGKIEGAGITRYMRELNTGLLQNNVEAHLYVLNTNNQNYTGKQGLFYDDFRPLEMTSDLSKYDYIFVHQMPSKKTQASQIEQFINLIKNTNAKKVLFFNDHSKTTTGFTKHYGPYLKDKEFLNMFDFYCIHCPTNAFARQIIKMIGKDEFNKKYVHLHHPHTFTNTNFTPFKEKHKRLTYIGRYLTTKHIEQIFNLYDSFKDFEYEIRGIDRTLVNTFVPNLIYTLENEKIIGPSKYTYYPSTKECEELGDKNGIDIKHSNDKIWSFGSYTHDTGMEAIRKSMFGLSFYRLPDGEYGDNLEYAMHEIVEQGTIPIFDKHMLRSIKLYRNGVPTNFTLDDTGEFIGLEPDLSNINQVIEQILYYSKDEQTYTSKVDSIYKVLKMHLNAKGIAKVLLDRLCQY